MIIIIMSSRYKNLTGVKIKESRLGFYFGIHNDDDDDDETYKKKKKNFGCDVIKNSRTEKGEIYNPTWRTSADVSGVAIPRDDDDDDDDVEV